MAGGGEEGIKGEDGSKEEGGKGEGWAGHGKGRYARCGKETNMSGRMKCVQGVLSKLGAPVDTYIYIYNVSLFSL